MPLIRSTWTHSLNRAKIILLASWNRLWSKHKLYLHTSIWAIGAMNNFTIPIEDGILAAPRYVCCTFNIILLIHFSVDDGSGYDVALCFSDPTDVSRCLFPQFFSHEYTCSHQALHMLTDNSPYSEVWRLEPRVHQAELNSRDWKHNFQHASVHTSIYHLIPISDGSICP